MAPRNSMPPNPRNMSVWSWSSTSITPPGGSAGSTAPVRASSDWKCMSPPAAPGLGPVVTFTTGRSVSKLM